MRKRLGPVRVRCSKYPLLLSLLLNVVQSTREMDRIVYEPSTRRGFVQAVY